MAPLLSDNDIRISAELEIRELVLCLENRWIKIESQILLLRDVWNDLPEKHQVHQVHQETVLHVLYTKLQRAYQLLDNAIGSPKASKLFANVVAVTGGLHKKYYAFILKDRLKDAVEDLEKWHRMFNPLWFLITRIPSPTKHPSSKHDSICVLRKLRYLCSSLRQTC